MQYLRLASILSLAAYALAANPNAFTSPQGSDTLYAGSDFVLEWDNTDGGDNVDLVLVAGTANNLHTVLTIAKSLSNEGAVRWSVPSTVTSGNYSIEIIDDSNQDNINYSPTFDIVNNVTGTSSIVPTTSEESTTGVNSSTLAVSTTATGLNTSATVLPSGVNSTASGNLSTGATGSAQETSTGKKSGSATGTGAGSGAASANGSESASASSKAGAAATGVGSILLGAGLGAAALFAL